MNVWREAPPTELRRPRPLGASRSPPSALAGFQFILFYTFMTFPFPFGNPLPSHLHSRSLCSCPGRTDCFESPEVTSGLRSSSACRPYPPRPHVPGEFGRVRPQTLGARPSCHGDGGWRRRRPNPAPEPPPV